MSRAALFVSLVALLVAFGAFDGRSADAAHPEFRYKWPWDPRDNTHVIVTTRPGQYPHSTANAWDFDYAWDGQGSRAIVSAAEGSVIDFRENQMRCDAGGGFGDFVRVSQADLSPGMSNDLDANILTYAHLSRIAFPLPSPLLQGDYVGDEGDTGNAIFEGACAPHLHWEFSLPISRPEKIDGAFTSGVVEGSTPTSSAAEIGQLGTLGGAMRSEYTAQGGWPAVGWLRDVGRGLGMHKYLSPSGYWGWEQTFRRHPDSFGFQDGGIYVGRWNQFDAYWVQPLFWWRWSQGGILEGDSVSYHNISLPLQGQQSGCPQPRSWCIGYQRFHLGYIYRHSSLGPLAYFCPDVAPKDYTGPVFQDNYVLGNDVVAVANHGISQDGDALYDPWYDIDGDGFILGNDVIIVSVAAFRICYPT